MNEPPKDDKGKESDFSEFARARGTEPESSGGAKDSGGSFLRGCGIALGISFLLFAFVVGACFMSI